jgi:hypothetical protein
MNEDQAWQALLARSSSTFTGESTPPYGFITATTARLRAEQGQVAEMERIGWRALLASFGVLALAAAITFGVNTTDRNDFDPGVRTLVQVDNIQVS